MSIRLGYDFIVISLVECRKGEEENFFHTFNFSHPKFLYEQSLMNSVERIMNKKKQDKIKEDHKNQNELYNFIITTMSPQTHELLKEIQTINPFTIDWSNIMDFFSK